MRVTLAVVCFIVAMLGFNSDHWVMAFVALCCAGYWVLDLIEDIR